jgi:class 3 adenylate cyclase/pimeloyl-ACP methyl ester carboxylesterase
MPSERESGSDWKSPVRYATTRDGSVAYRLITGDADSPHHLVLLLSGTASMEALFEDPIGSRLIYGLAGMGRVAVFDRRGIGLSESPAAWDDFASTRWCEDVEAVVEAAALVRPAIVSGLGSGAAAILYCDRHSDDVMSSIMVEPFGTRVDEDSIRAQLAGEMDSIARWCPSRSDEPGFREWFTRAGQLGASPRAAERAYSAGGADEARAIELAAARIRVPTLVLRRPANALSPRREHDPITALVADSVRVDLPGEDLLLFGGEVDPLLAEVSRFVTGRYLRPEPERVLAAVLFSDLVASTRRASQVGDAQWKRQLDRHDRISTSCVNQHGGTVVDTTGDGILAVFASATGAVRGGLALRTALHDEGLEVRVGIHAGDLERRDTNVSGIAVHIAARIMALAGPAEILTSETVRLLATGAGIQFEDRGRHELKGVSDPCQLHAVATTDRRSFAAGHETLASRI